MKDYVIGVSLGCLMGALLIMVMGYGNPVLMVEYGSNGGGPMFGIGRGLQIAIWALIVGLAGLFIASRLTRK